MSSRLGYPRWYGPGLALVMVALGALIMLSRASIWYGSTLLTTAMLLENTAQLAVICTAVAAAAYPIHHRRALAALDNQSSRPAWVLVALRAAITAAWALVGYALLCAGSLAVNAMSSPGDRIGFVNLVIGAAIVVVATVAGAVAGALWPRLATPLLAALAMLVFFWSGSENAPDNIRHLFLSYGAAELSREPRLDVALWKLLWVVALLVGLFTLAAVRGPGSRDPRHSARMRTAIVGTLLAAVLAIPAVAGMWNVGRDPTARSDPREFAVCGGSTVQVCLWEDHKRHLGDVVRMVEAAAQVTGELPFPPGVTRFEEYGIATLPGTDETVAGNGVITSDRGRLRMEEVVTQLANQWYTAAADRCDVPLDQWGTWRPEIRSILDDLLTDAASGPVDIPAARAAYASLRGC